MGLHFDLATNELWPELVYLRFFKSKKVDLTPVPVIAGFGSLGTRNSVMTSKTCRGWPFRVHTSINILNLDVATLPKYMF